MSLVRIADSELRVGQPVPWSLYDENRVLLLARGVVVASEEQLNQLLERGLFRKLKLTEAGEAEEPRRNAEAPVQGSCTLEDIKLAIGDTLQLQSQADNDATRYYVKLIGYLRGKGLVVTTPTLDGKVLLMREGQSFVVRMFSGKSAYAFPASIFKVANVPYPHLHLTYPAQVRGLVVRNGARVRAKLIASIQSVGGKTVAGTISNLSTGGAAVTVKEPVGVTGETVTLKFRIAIDEVEQYLGLQGLIRSTQGEVAEEGGGAQVQHGIQFVEIPQIEYLSLSAYVYRKLFEQTAV